MRRCAYMMLQPVHNLGKRIRLFRQNINDTIMIFRSDGVLFDSTFAEMDAASRAWYHIGIIGL